MCPLAPNEAKQLVALLQHDSPNVRRAAVVRLAREKAEGVVGPLAKALRDKVWQVRQAAASALAEVGKEAAGEALLARFGAPETSLRPQVLEILGQARPPAAEDAAGARRSGTAAMSGDAAKGAKDIEDNWHVRKAIAQAIARLRPDLFREPLLKALDSDSSNHKIAAMSGLATLGDPSVAQRIAPHCSHSEANVQRAAAVALGKLRAREGLEPLIELCQSKNAGIRAEALIALNHIKADEAYEALAGCLRDLDTRVRSTAVLAVGNTRNEKALEKLVPMLKDHEAEVRAAVCQALVTLKACANAEEIGALLLDEDKQVSEAAARAYCQLTVEGL